jgi:hypothetical protein
MTGTTRLWFPRRFTRVPIFVLSATGPGICSARSSARAECRGVPGSIACHVLAGGGDSLAEQ